MDPFIQRLVERLLDLQRPMSRNRHFHTFETAEGKRALRISRRLQALARDVVRSTEEGAVPVIHRREDDDGQVRVEVHLARLKTTRVTTLDEGEFELLCTLPGVRAALTPG